MTIYVSSYLVESQNVRKQSSGLSFLVKDNPRPVQHSLGSVTWHMDSVGRVLLAVIHLPGLSNSVSRILGGLTIEQKYIIY